MRFLLLVIDSHWSRDVPGEIAEIDAFNDKLKSNGHWIYAWGLHGPERSQIFDNRNGASSVEAKSLIESDENYSGFWLFEAQDQSEADALALEASRACNRKLELRPLH
jgi:hypothetical protein